MLNDCINLQAWAVSGGNEGIADRFHELVPDMALDFPFELDTFQKEVFLGPSLFYLTVKIVDWLFVDSLKVRLGDQKGWHGDTESDIYRF